MKQYFVYVPTRSLYCPQRMTIQSTLEDADRQARMIALEGKEAFVYELVRTYTPSVAVKDVP